MDHEIKGYGNATTAQYWEYDTRIGRRWNIDPVKKYSLSPYSVFSNNPAIMIDPKGSDEYWEIDAKTGVIKMTKSDWVGDNIWIKDKDGVLKKLHEIKIEFRKSSRQFDNGVAAVLIHYTSTAAFSEKVNSLTITDDDVNNIADFDPNTNEIRVPVVNGYLNSDLTNMFNLKGTINDHEKKHQNDFQKGARTNVLSHLNVYISEISSDNFSMTDFDHQSVSIANALNYLYTLTQETNLDEKEKKGYLEKFYKAASRAGWTLNADHDDDGNVTGFDLYNRRDQEHFHYQPTYKSKINEEK